MHRSQHIIGHVYLENQNLIVAYPLGSRAHLRYTTVAVRIIMSVRSSARASRRCASHSELIESEDEFLHDLLCIPGGNRHVRASHSELVESEDEFFYDLLCIPGGNRHESRKKSRLHSPPRLPRASQPPAREDRQHNAEKPEPCEMPRASQPRAREDRRRTPKKSKPCEIEADDIEFDAIIVELRADPSIFVIPTKIPGWVDSEFYVRGVLASSIFAWKIGLTSNPSFRFFNNKFGYHMSGFERMHVLHLGSPADCARLERFLIQNLSYLAGCWNVKPGGENPPKDGPCFVYLVTAYAGGPTAFWVKKNNHDRG